MMKHNKKILITLIFLCSVLSSVHSSEMLFEEERLRGRAMAEFLLSPDQKYLMKPENEKFCNLVSLALARKNRFDAQHPENKEEKTIDRLDYFWFYVLPHLRDEEQKDFHDLLEKAFTKGKPSSSGHKLVDKTLVKTDANLSKEKWKETQHVMGHLMLSAWPYLNANERKSVFDILQRGHEREYLNKSGKKKNNPQKEVGKP